jgi:ribosomal protein S21
VRPANCIIEVVEGNVEQALSALKSQMQKTGAFAKIKAHEYVETKSQKRRRKSAIARRRRAKGLRKLMARERTLDDKLFARSTARPGQRTRRLAA